MGKVLYHIFITLYPLLARLAALFNSKARKWVTGRKDIMNTIAEAVKPLDAGTVWVHCSSLGEFEQGRPLLEKIKTLHPQYKIILTFFSPSGYEVQKKYSKADYIFYLPMDSPANAARFYDIIRPSLVIFVKYEFWNYFLKEAHKRKIPLLLVSGIFRKSQPFFAWYGGFYRQMLQYFSFLFVQNEASLQLLEGIGITHASISGDTRFDRVLEIAATHKNIDGIEDFCEGKTVIVAGSTWTEDDEELDHYANTHRDYRFIIAPHDITEERLKECDALYKYSIRYSTYLQLLKSGIPTQEVNTLIIDNIGLLGYLYRYGKVCFVGGGFGGDGVHNVLEPAVYGRPVLFGPVYDKFFEAVELLDAEGAFTVEGALELEKQLDILLSDATAYKKACGNAGNYVKNKSGATATIVNYIQEKRLLTN
ncbi:3-deoxy-D-manno-octulosonic acid transferase [Foetidibacter luteolus]|uniref:3-deoxy-D-manno-octulosonic acid transferase n=1 Tax=Foetidibacter luteolus TaxID=2608880 RepID=UPI00129B4592|nr:glycosyltransferase N-terminal domain-containing protein [Foetidibacter luteolus]